MITLTSLSQSCSVIVLTSNKTLDLLIYLVACSDNSIGAAAELFLKEDSFNIDNGHCAMKVLLGFIPTSQSRRLLNHSSL